jgi:hypothetical protein
MRVFSIDFKEGVNDAIQQGAEALSENITATLKELLETKHLYQSIDTLSYEVILKAVESNFRGIYVDMVRQRIGELWSRSWHALPLSQKREGPVLSLWRTGPTGLFILSFRIPHLKLFCHRCDRVEVFNHLSGWDMLETDVAGTGATPDDNKPTTQIFVLSFLCQSCKSIPEVFLVRRKGNKLTLSGRSPIEHVEQPHDIPKPISRYYSGAVIAHQSGQTLAGVFLFRVLIEQWVQSQARTKDLKVDVALEEYMEGLPNDFKARFSSFRALYEKLSADIHRATGSADLFEDAQQQIVEHFKARRLFKLPKKRL